ncbi:hypothetical protein BV96_01245 [Sphingomonas paucimobilis]|nr:hypothetical protein BV96_01245 [Sphingomonas paucimobilis]
MDMKRHLSGPTRELLRKSALLPDHLDEALNALVCCKASAVLRRDHPLIREIAKATSINVTQIARKSRYLLIEVEQSSADGPIWQYREHAPRNCIFSCMGNLPATAMAGLQGEPLAALVSPPLAMDGVMINRVEENGDGWLTVSVTPPWHLF